MVTIKQCIIGKIRASNPCRIDSLLFEIGLQQTEYSIRVPYNEIGEYLNSLIKEGKIIIDMCGPNIVFDLPK